MAVARYRERYSTTTPNVNNDSKWIYSATQGRNFFLGFFDVSDDFSGLVSYVLDFFTVVKNYSWDTF